MIDNARLNGLLILTLRWMFQNGQVSERKVYFTCHPRKRDIPLQALSHLTHLGKLRYDFVNATGSIVRRTGIENPSGKLPFLSSSVYIGLHKPVQITFSTRLVWSVNDSYR